MRSRQVGSVLGGLVRWKAWSRVNPRAGCRAIPSIAAVVGLVLWGLVGEARAQLTAEDIAALDRQGQVEGWTFSVRASETTARPLSELCGLVEPPDWRAGARFDPCTPLRDLPSSYDWRAISGCPPVRNQGGCGSCWAFGTVGPLECNILIRTGLTVNLSEQWLVSCNEDGWGCSGGWFAHDYHSWKTDPCGGTGAVLESSFPYVASDVPCRCPYAHPYKIDSWAYIGSQYGVPSVSAMKQAIVQYGPISVAIYVNSAFQAYGGGVFNACENGQVNHAVVLVGWDDNQGANGVWFLRNSWSSGWGEGGYMRIAYGCSKVGYGACYVDCGSWDCNHNGISDADEIAANPSLDCQPDTVLDECQLAGNDCNGNQVPDDCEATEILVQHPVDQVPCPGGTATFLVVASGATGYQWYKDGTAVSNGGDVSGAQTDTLTVRNAEDADEGVYECRVSAGCVQTVSEQAELTVGSAPVPAPLNGLTKCEGGAVAWVARFTGAPAMSYQWQRWNGDSFADIPGEDYHTLYIPAASPADAGSYRCRATNACGQAVTNGVTLSVIPVPAILEPPADTCAEAGEATVFEVVAGGGEPLFYWWRMNGIVLWGEYADRLTLSGIEPGDAGSYDVLVSFSAGFECAGVSDAAILTVGGCWACSYGPGDVDGDADVDLYDFALFQACFGPGMGLVPGCECANFPQTADDDVTLADFLAWQTLLGGP